MGYCYHSLFFEIMFPCLNSYEENQAMVIVKQRSRKFIFPATIFCRRSLSVWIDKGCYCWGVLTAPRSSHIRSDESP